MDKKAWMTTRYIISTEHKICALSTKHHKHNAFLKDWIWLDIKKDFTFSSYVSIDSELATCGVSSMDELCDDCEGCNSIGKEGDEHDLGPGIVLLNPCYL